jgi:hypothetical protein
MEHLYNSIKIKDYLIKYFPLPNIPLELIINNLKLAIDLNGYTNENLKYYIKFNFNNNNQKLNLYLKKKYGKYRSNLNLLKKYQLIHIIQYFNINIPIKPNKDYILNIFKDKYNINININKNIINFSINNDNFNFLKKKLIKININSEHNIYLYFKNIIIYNKDYYISNFIIFNDFKYLTLYYNTFNPFKINKLILLYYYTTILNNNLNFENYNINEFNIEMINIYKTLFNNVKPLHVFHCDSDFFISKDELNYLILKIIKNDINH